MTDTEKHTANERTMQSAVTLDELDAALNAQRVAPTPTVAAIIEGLDIDEVLEIASETDERGPLATFKDMLEALRVRHRGTTSRWRSWQRWSSSTFPS